MTKNWQKKTKNIIITEIKIWIPGASAIPDITEKEEKKFTRITESVLVIEDFSKSVTDLLVNLY